jgi:hypothetical protein
MVGILEGLAILGLILLVIAILIQHRLDILLGISFLLALNISLKYFEGFPILQKALYILGLTIIIFVVSGTLLSLIWEDFRKIFNKIIAYIRSI